MDVNIENSAWEKQKQTLDIFLELGAISQAHHGKSLHDLKEKMGIEG